MGSVKRTLTAVVEGVAMVNDNLAVIRYRYDPEPADGLATGAARIPREEWPMAYWPPAKGDVLRVREAPSITLEARPR